MLPGQGAYLLLLIAIRALILYTILVTVTRVMGKRQVGELQPFEFVIAILLAELAAIPMGDKETPLINGVAAIFTLLVAHIFVSYLALEVQSVRHVVCGRPAVLVENGIIQETQLRSLRYNINDLLEQLRGKGYADISNVEFAILETNGKLSVIPKSQVRPVQPIDLQLDTKYEGLPHTFVVDGYVDDKALEKANLNRLWLQRELAKFGIHNIKNVLFVSLSTAGNLFYQLKEAKQRRRS